MKLKLGEPTTRWTPLLIRRLRGKRTQKEFGALVGVALNTVWRWEDGSVAPAPEHHQRLSEIADEERFLKDWHLAGSAILVGNLDSSITRLRSRQGQIMAERKRKPVG